MKRMICGLLICLGMIRVWAWGVEHNALAQLTGELLPEEIRTNLVSSSFEKLIAFSGTPDSHESVEKLIDVLGANDVAFLETNGVRRLYDFHHTQNQARLVLLMARAFQAHAWEKATVLISILSHTVADAGAINHSPLIHELTYALPKGVVFSSEPFEEGLKSGFSFRTNGPVVDLARGFLQKERGEQSASTNTLLELLLENVSLTTYSAEKEGDVLFGSLQTRRSTLARMIEKQVRVIERLVAWAWKNRLVQDDISLAELDRSFLETRQKLMRTYPPNHLFIFRDLFDETQNPVQAKGTLVVVCEPQVVFNSCLLSYGGRLLTAAAARTARAQGWRVKALSVDALKTQQSLPPLATNTVLLLVKGNGALPKEYAQTIRQWRAEGGRLILVGGSDSDDLTGFSSHLKRQPDAEFPTSHGWYAQGAGDFHRMRVQIGERIIPQRHTANLNGFVKPTCVLAVEDGVNCKRLVSFQYQGEEGVRTTCVAAQKGHVIWCPAWLLWPFIFSNDTSCDWAHRSLDSFASGVFLDFLERLVSNE